MPNTTSVESSVWLPVALSEAFDLVTKPDRLRRWLMVAGRIDLSVGGDVHLVVAPGAHAVGKVTELVPGCRFSYTHGWVGDEELPPGTSEVTVLLAAQGEGTDVTIRHHGIPETAADGMQTGWDDFTARLTQTAVGVSNSRDWPATQELSSPDAILDSALFALLATLRGCTPEDGQRPTPCDEFMVADLAQHLIDNATMLGQALGRQLSERSGQDMEDNVAVALWACVESVQALAADDEVDLGGQSIQAQQLMKYLSVEFLVHASDVARATSSEVDASPELAEAVLRYAEETRSTLFVTDETFASPVTAPPGSGPLERLLALTGRAADAQT